MPKEKALDPLAAAFAEVRNSAHQWRTLESILGAEAFANLRKPSPKRDWREDSEADRALQWLSADLQRSWRTTDQSMETCDAAAARAMDIP